MTRSRTSPTRSDEVRLFISYSHKDDFWMQSLLPLLRFPGVKVKPWHDKEIRPGVRWDKDIKKALEEMHVFIALVSVNFAVSDYINEVEYPIAQKLHRQGKIEVIPVLVHDPGKEECVWLMELQRVPPGTKSWAEVLQEFQLHDRALTPIREGIRAVVERARDRLRGVNRRAKP